MKKLYYLVIPALAVGFVTLMAAFSGEGLKSSGGAPAGYTNSPADGQNCSHCMGGTAAPVTGWITSDIPVTGYVPGNTYTVFVTASGTGKKGFQVSPQDDAGNLIGTLTAGTGNKLVGSNKYVTHNAAQNGDPATWSFQWTAPSTGAGVVTFYGSIAVGKTNTKTTTMTVSQSTVGMEEQGRAFVSVFPNPASERINVSFNMEKEGDAAFQLLDARGRQVKNLGNETVPSGPISRTFDIDQPAGIYFLRLITAGTAHVSKIIVN